MIYTEIIIKKDTKGNTLESIRDCFEDSVIGKKVTRVNVYGKNICYDFKTMKATYWYVGNSENTKKVKINLVN